MTTPKIIDSCGALLQRYEVLLCDVWGVVHDGQRAFDDANTVLAGFRRAGGTVILVSNAPTPSDNVARVLDEKGVWRDAWDAIVSSGDLALSYVHGQGWDRIHHIGPQGRDRAFFAALGGVSSPIEDAQGITCTGLVDDRTETAETYRGLLERALGRGLVLVCANPDLVVHVGDDLLPCAGALGALYEELGGEVIWAGKPYPLAYRRALDEAERLRGKPIDRRKVLAIGDSVRTDIAAAQGAGVDALFISGGIHRHDAMTNGEVSSEGLAKIFGKGAPPAIAAASGLRP